MSNDLNAEFFRLIGWTKLSANAYPLGADLWRRPPRSDWYIEAVLPNPAGSWDDFHKWVVPEIVKLGYKDRCYLRNAVWDAFTDPHGTPENALRWAIEEIND